MISECLEDIGGDFKKRERYRLKTSGSQEDTGRGHQAVRKLQVVGLRKSVAYTWGMSGSQEDRGG